MAGKRKNTNPETPSQETRVEQGQGGGGEQRIGLERFLQLSPQKSGVTALLRSKYAGAVQTQEQWGSAVDVLLRKKAH